MRPIQIFFTGMLISFLGTLPLGTLNISAMQISLSDGVRPALLFSTGALLVEILYVRLSLVAMNRILRHKRLLVSLEWVTLTIITALAIASFYAASHPSVHRNPILSNTIHRFWLGAGMSALNPMQVPFWFGWSTVLFNRGILRQQQSDFNTYILGIGIGTFLGNSVFIFGGRLLVERLNTNQHLLNWIIGGIFASTAVIQLVRMLRHSDAISKMKGVEEKASSG